MRLSVPRTTLLALAIVLCALNLATAQAGKLDTTFATGGIFVNPTKSSEGGLAMQPDGKIIIAGSGVFNNAIDDALLRLDTHGALDTSFGVGGVVDIVPPGGTFNQYGFFGLAIQPDGKIVAAAETFAGTLATLFVVRVEANGMLDTSFGTGGFTTAVSVTTGNSFFSGNLALQPDGKIVVVAGNGDPSIMTRFTSSGQLDKTFGSGGVVNLLNPMPTQAVVQPDGKILVASGEQARLVLQPQPAAQAGTLARYNSNGSVDKSFGAAGLVATVPSASALALQSDGKIVVGGTLVSKLNAPPAVSNLGFGVVRYSTSGMIDSSFGAGGLAAADFGGAAPIAGAFAVAVQSNGDLLLAGTAGIKSGTATVSSFGVARFTSAGKLDSTFGSRGIVITPVPKNDFGWLNGLTIQSDGKIVAAGVARLLVFENGYVLRYLSQ